MSKLSQNKVWVVIPAAGLGTRMQTDLPKQYLKIGKKTVIEHTLECFIHHPSIAGIIVALNTEDPYWNALKINPVEVPLYTVEGGNERSDSVYNAIEYLLTVEKSSQDTWVMVHDAARPCLAQKDIDVLLNLRVKKTIGGLLATPVRDTMKRAKSDSMSISHTVKREDLWHAQTPQLFRLKHLKLALENCLDKGIEVTDESSALEAIGENPTLIEGSSYNIKITHPQDIELASYFLSRRNFKD